MVYSVERKNWPLPLKFISLLLLGAKMPWLLKQKKRYIFSTSADFVTHGELAPSTGTVLRQRTERDLSKWICTSVSFLFSSIYIPEMTVVMCCLQKAWVCMSGQGGRRLGLQLRCTLSKLNKMRLGFDADQEDTAVSLPECLNGSINQYNHYLRTKHNYKNVSLKLPSCAMVKMILCSCQGKLRCDQVLCACIEMKHTGKRH